VSGAKVTGFQIATPVSTITAAMGGMEK